MPQKATHPKTKICASCGREITWRRKWANSWDSVKYCSDACRRSKSESRHEELEVAILELLNKRSAQSSVCPSEVARRIAGDDETVWRGMMEEVRRAARRLCAKGKIVITQGGQTVDPSRAKGPIRLKRMH